MNGMKPKQVSKAVAAPEGSTDVPKLRGDRYRVASLIPGREWNFPGDDWSEGNELRLGLLARSLYKLKGKQPSIFVCPAGFFQFQDTMPAVAAQLIADDVAEMLAALAPNTSVVAGLDVWSGGLWAQTVIAADKNGLQKQVFKLVPTNGKTAWGSEYFEPVDLTLASASIDDRTVVIDGKKVVLAVCYDVYGLHESAMAADRNVTLGRAIARGGANLAIAAIEACLQAKEAWSRAAPDLIINCVHNFDGGSGRFKTQWAHLCDATSVPLLAAALYTDVEDASLKFCWQRDPTTPSRGSPIAMVGDFWWYVDHEPGKDWVWVQCFDLNI